jgi:hypothetical protein
MWLKKKGRNFWGWTLIPFFIFFVFGVVFASFLVHVSGSFVGIMTFFISFIVIYIVSLILVLASGETDKKRMDRIYEEEKIRELIRSNNTDTKIPNPSGKTINDMYKR